MTPQQFKNIRLKIGMTQVELAKTIGKSQNCVWSYEKGRSVIPPAVALAMLHLKATYSHQF